MKTNKNLVNISIKLFGNRVKASRNRDALTRFSAAHSSFRTGLIICFLMLSACNNVNKSAQEEVTAESEKIIIEKEIVNETEIIFYDYENESRIPKLTDEDFIIKYDNTFIEIKGTYEDMITNEDITYFREMSEKRAYEITEFENFRIEHGLVIGEITLLTPKLATARDIRVGDNIEKALQAYELNKYLDDRYYTCSHNYKYLEFYIDENQIITKIILEIL